MPVADRLFPARRALAACAVIALLGAIVMIQSGQREVRGATGTTTGSVSGEGTIIVGSLTYLVSVSASTDGVTPTGSLTFVPYTTGQPRPSFAPVSAACLFVNGSTATIGVASPSAQLFFITDNGPTGALDALEVLAQPGGPDCTTSPSAPTTLSSGNFTVVGPPVDANGDGIIDSLQPSGTPTGSFVDATTTPATTGSIVSTGGLSVLIEDAAAPDGVTVTVGSEVGGAQAELLACGGTVLVDAGSVITITCHSLIVRVTTGQVTVTLSGGTTIVTVPEGGSVEVTDTGGGVYDVANLGTVELTLTVDGATTVIPSGGSSSTQTWVFDGFSAPIDNAPVMNRAKAGQAIPIRWRLVDGAGQPVTTLARASLSAVTISCTLGLTSDQVEETATGASGLLNLGDGYYQVNWKSPTTYAGSCKTLHVDLDGVVHDALFMFTR